MKGPIKTYMNCVVRMFANFTMSNLVSSDHHSLNAVQSNSYAIVKHGSQIELEDYEITTLKNTPLNSATRLATEQHNTLQYEGAKYRTWNALFRVNFLLDLVRLLRSGLALRGLGRRVDGVLGVHGVERSVDGALVFLEDRLDHHVIHHSRALVLGKHAPHQESHLNGVVEGHPVENVVREVLDHAEEGEHNPVSEPLCVVLLAGALDGRETAVCRIHESHEVGDRTSEESAEDAQRHDGQETNHEVLNVDFGLLFDQLGVLLQCRNFEDVGTQSVEMSSNSRHVEDNRQFRKFIQID